MLPEISGSRNISQQTCARQSLELNSYMEPPVLALIVILHVADTCDFGRHWLVTVTRWFFLNTILV